MPHNGRRHVQGGCAMELDELVAAMNQQAGKLKELNHTVLFDLGDDGRILLDATGDAVKVVPNPGSDDADTTLALSSENLVKLMEGDLNPMVAFTMGRLKIFGSKGIALKLASLLDS
jgi:putative sterol carrier protein